MTDFEKIKALKLTCPFCGKEMKNRRAWGVDEMLEDGEWHKDFFQYGTFSCECGVEGNLFTDAFSHSYNVCFEKTQTIEK